jgi:hypothetical protein
MIKRSIPLMLQLSFLAILILIISVVIQFWIPEIRISKNWFVALIILYLFTLLAIQLLVKYIKSRISHFANAFMLLNFGKLLLFSIVIVVYSIINHDDAISFTLTFFLYYLIFTSYETITLLKLQKQG